MNINIFARGCELHFFLNQFLIAMKMRTTQVKLLCKQQLRERYDAERQILDLLPELYPLLSNQRLIEVIDHNRAICQEHLQRLEHCFKLLGENPFGGVCEGTMGIVNQTREKLGERYESQMAEVLIVAALKQLCCTNLVGYFLAQAYAQQLQNEVLSDHLRQMLQEEQEANAVLNGMLVYVTSDSCLPNMGMA